MNPWEKYQQGDISTTPNVVSTPDGPWNKFKNGENKPPESNFISKLGDAAIEIPGILASSAVKTGGRILSGVNNIVQHPLHTLSGINDAIQHPLDTVKAYGKGIADKYNDNDPFGVIADIVPALGGVGGALSKIGEANNLARVSAVGNAMTDASMVPLKSVKAAVLKLPGVSDNIAMREAGYSSLENPINTKTKTATNEIDDVVHIFGKDIGNVFDSNPGKITVEQKPLLETISTLPESLQKSISNNSNIIKDSSGNPVSNLKNIHEIGKIIDDGIRYVTAESPPESQRVLNNADMALGKMIKTAYPDIKPLYDKFSQLKTLARPIQRAMYNQKDHLATPDRLQSLIGKKSPFGQTDVQRNVEILRNQLPAFDDLIGSMKTKTRLAVVKNLIKEGGKKGIEALPFVGALKAFGSKGGSNIVETGESIP